MRTARGTEAEAEQLSFRARALAQAHPLSATARQYVDQAVARQRLDQPLPEIGTWAGGALTAGYCLRRVEEAVAAASASTSAGAAVSEAVAGPAVDGPAVDGPAVDGPAVDGPAVDGPALEERATTRAAAVRAGTTAAFALLAPELTEGALDRLVDSAVRARLSHWAESIDEDAWAELEEYLTWWTVKGYGLRVAEAELSRASGAAPPGP